MNDKDAILDVLLKEYDKLKSEQAQRIGFRDNLLYVTRRGQGDGGTRGRCLPIPLSGGNAQGFHAPTK